VNPVPREEDSDSIRYETLMIGLSQLPDGRWFPARSRLHYTITTDATYLDDVDIQLTDIQVASTSVADSLFHIAWPEGAQVRDNTHLHSRTEDRSDKGIIKGA
jgi:hypothetical protein